MRQINTRILNSILAARFGLDLKLIEWTARRLRESGLFPHGRRGENGGVFVNSTDTARLIVGIAASESAARSPELVRAYETLPMANWSIDTHLAGGEVNSQYFAPDDLLGPDIPPISFERLTSSVVSAIAGQIDVLAMLIARGEVIQASWLPHWTVLRSKDRPGGFFTVPDPDSGLTRNFAYMRDGHFYDAEYGPPVAAMPIPAVVMVEVAQAFAEAGSGEGDIEVEPQPAGGDDPNKVA